MKILARRYDDLVRQEQEYNGRLAPLQKRSQEINDRYESAKHDFMGSVKEDIINALKGDLGYFPSDVSVKVESYWPGVRVSFEKGRGDTTALRWSYDVSLDEHGEVKKDSSSWSGLEAVTDEQVADLKESVKVIEAIFRMDWSDILNHAQNDKPRYDDFKDEELDQQIRELESNKPKTNADAKTIALIEDCMDDSEYIALSFEPWIESERIYSYWRRKNIAGWFKPTKETDKFFTGEYVSRWSVPDGSESIPASASRSTVRVSKGKLLAILSTSRKEDGSIIIMPESND